MSATPTTTTATPTSAKNGALPYSEDADYPIFVMIMLLLLGVLITGCLLLRRIRNRRIQPGGLGEVEPPTRNTSVTTVATLDEKEDFGEV
jgi:hypothetical protein